MRGAKVHLQKDESVKPALIDTDILSLFLRGHPSVVQSFSAYVQEYGGVNLCILSYYEIVSGLKHRDAKKQLDSFQDFIQYNSILLLTEQSVLVAADIYAELRRRGDPVDDIDILIAAVAKAHGLVMVTHNTGHFRRIPGLELEDWSLQEN